MDPRLFRSFDACPLRRIYSVLKPITDFPTLPPLVPSAQGICLRNARGLTFLMVKTSAAPLHPQAGGVDDVI